MDYVPIRLRVERLPEGVYLATSPDVPSLIVQVDTLDRLVFEVTDVLRMLIETWQEMGIELPPVLKPKAESDSIEVVVPIGLPAKVA